MAQPPRRGIERPDARAMADKAFKAATTKPAEDPPKPAIIPGQREQVTLRIDSAVLERFQEDGPGWQDRINEALRKAAGLDANDDREGLPVEELTAQNDT